MMLRSLMFGMFVVGSGCPNPPMPPVNPPMPVVLDAGPAHRDAGTDAPLVCNVPQSTQDKLTGRAVNACATVGSLDTVAKGYDIVTVRCVMSDLLIDLREAPRLEACVSSWMRGHGGLP